VSIGAPSYPLSEPAPSLVVYENPLNERMRTFLRLEFLYSQLLYHTELPNSWSSRAAMASLLEALAILGRGDVRGEVIKELERHVQALNEFQAKPGVDPGRLRVVMSNLMRLRSELIGLGANFLQPLRDSEFLNAIKHRSAIPGGTCMFDLPDYGYWLHLPAAERRRQLVDWINHIKPICEAVAEVLWLTREATEATPQVAPGGMFQHGFDRGEQASLVRVLMPANGGIFPEVSAGQHRFTIRFVRWRGVDARPAQVTQDVRFQLAIC
jgi:cell division protein ZapD